ncbi:MAG: alpha/beta fold hydrolase [Bacteroidota bacterium]
MAQDITGDWHGLLEQLRLRVVFHISETENGYTSTLDSPDQGAKGIPVTSTQFKNDSLTITVAPIGVVYKAKWMGSEFQGTFTQGGLQIPLRLTREAVKKSKRPQDPEPPYPYLEEEVQFPNEKAGITLAGTLTFPQGEGKFPAVVLISGTGPQDRNEELVGHKPFLVLTDHLTRNGIAVLRFDDRGFGQSTGDFAAATTADFATDVSAAVSFLRTRKEIDPTTIGLVGHSEGGLIAPIVASESDTIAFIVMLAGTGIPGNELLALQGRLIEEAMEKPLEEVEKSAMLREKMIQMVMDSDDISTLKRQLKAYLEAEIEKGDLSSLVPKGMDTKQFIDTQLNFMATPWMVYFLNYDPADALVKVHCPVLALIGEKDLQVPPKENLEPIEKALKKAGNPNITLKELPGLNHLFQESETGLPQEYGVIEQTFSPKALAIISSWISEKTK